MKKWVWLPVAVFFLVTFLCCQKQTEEAVPGREEKQNTKQIAPVAQSLEDMIDAAAANFQKGEAAKGVGLLLDGILLVKPRDNWPHGFVNSIFLAKEHFQNGNLTQFNEDISDALSMLQPPLDESVDEGEDMPPDSGQSEMEASPAPVAQIFSSLISSSKEEFRLGNVDSGVIKLLEALQLVAPRTQ